MGSYEELSHATQSHEGSPVPVQHPVRSFFNSSTGNLPRPYASAPDIIKHFIYPITAPFTSKMYSSLLSESCLLLHTSHSLHSPSISITNHTPVLLHLLISSELWFMIRRRLTFSLIDAGVLFDSIRMFWCGRCVFSIRRTSPEPFVSRVCLILQCNAGVQ